MRAAYRKSMLLGLATIAILAGCAGRHREVVTAPPAAPVAAPMPVPPLGAVAGMTIPPLGPDGRRMTPNRNLSAQATLWHVRMALNVAALSCHDEGDGVRLRYNAFLKAQKATLAKANLQVDNEYKGRFGANAVTQRERLNTTVYNFFALPPVQRGFCERAAMVSGVIATLSAADLLSYAPSALASLEQPFVDFYDAYAHYQGQLAQWRSHSGQSYSRVEEPPVPLAIAAPSPKPVVLAMDLDRADMLQGDEVLSGRTRLDRVYAAR